MARIVALFLAFNMTAACNQSGGVELDLDTGDECPRRVWFYDRDSDGYGDPSVSVGECEAPGGYVADNTDCNDHLFWVNPGEDEVCDGVDNDCDLIIDDDAKDAQTWYYDGDLDGYGDSEDWDGDGEPGFSILACSYIPGGGWEPTADDCEDEDDTVYPGAPEVCGDDIINDCDEWEDNRDDYRDPPECEGER